MSRFLRSLSVLFFLTASSFVHAQASPLACDVDVDGDIDINDIRLVLAARNTPASGPDDPRDADGDGFITVLDARVCTLRCTLPGCAEPVSNTAPVADAGPDQTADVGETVTLNGAGSFDADGDALTFAWQIVVSPAGSSAALDDPTLVMLIFTVDEPGDYVVQLIVNDGTVDSAPVPSCPTFSRE